MDAAISSAPPVVSTSDRLEQTGMIAVLGFAAALQFSIAVAQSLLAIAIACWLMLVISRRERIAVPRFFWPLLVYAALTLASALLSAEPGASLVGSKQLVLFLIVPLVYRFASGARGQTLVTVIVTVGAASAAVGIVEYALLGWNNLGNRPRGTLGHYMTYSGLLMQVIGVALARVLFGGRDRLWALLVMPALTVAVVFSFGRSAAVGASLAIAVLLALKDIRLLILIPVIGAIFLLAAPDGVSQRMKSAFDANDPTRRDRIAMLRSGLHMIRDFPLVGVGPTQVPKVYAHYREPDAVEPMNPHLHNVPMQIAAERGLPALAVWLWFIAVVTLDLAAAFRAGPDRMLAATGLAAIVAMLAAGLFEYNFGDSEFLMLFLLLITLPFAAARDSSGPALA
jgi:O-antigen ligase